MDAMNQNLIGIILYALHITETTAVLFRLK